MIKVYRVLLIEDEAVTAEIAIQYLNRYNFTVTHIEDGREAPGKLRETAYDLIILDLMMPNVDGFGFLEAFDGLPEPVKTRAKVVMLSTSESFKDLNRANQNRYVYKFLNKPLNKAVLDAIRI